MNNLVWFKEFPSTTFPIERCGHCLRKFKKIPENFTGAIYAHKSKNGRNYQCFFHKECLQSWLTFQKEENLKHQLRCPGCTNKYSPVSFGSLKDRIKFNMAISTINILIGATVGTGIILVNFLFNLDKIQPQIPNPYFGVNSLQAFTLAEFQTKWNAAIFAREAASVFAGRALTLASGLGALTASRISFSEMTTKQRMIELSPLIVSFGIAYAYTGDTLGGILSVLPPAIFAGAIAGFIGGMKYTCELK